jgi:hypothetical protein
LTLLSKEILSAYGMPSQSNYQAWQSPACQIKA